MSICFNSKLVRLEARAMIEIPTGEKFQFQTGAIRRLRGKSKFQFQTGAISENNINIILTLTVPVKLIFIFIRFK